MSNERTLTSNPSGTEAQRREAFANFLAALDAKDIPMSMAATFQAGWDACMRRDRPAPETGERKLLLSDRADELIRELHGQGMVTMRSVFDGAILTILPDRPAQKANEGQS